MVQYCSSVLSLTLSARRFKKHVAAGPAPPDVDQMSGQKVDLSTSRIRCSCLARSGARGGGRGLGDWRERSTAREPDYYHYHGSIVDWNVVF